jgi:uncharacterized protein (DUF2141 family)
MKRLRLAPLPMLAPLLMGAAPHGGAVSVTVTDLRSSAGKVMACLAHEAESFPRCHSGKDRALVLPAGEATRFRFDDVPPGRYAIALLHDENGNGRIDKALMIPREGFGFSQNARIRMGPPDFGDAAFEVGTKGAHQSIRMRYLM